MKFIMIHHLKKLNSHDFLTHDNWTTVNYIGQECFLIKIEPDKEKIMLFGIEILCQVIKSLGLNWQVQPTTRDLSLRIMEWTHGPISQFMNQVHGSWTQSMSSELDLQKGPVSSKYFSIYVIWLLMILHIRTMSPIGTPKKGVQSNWEISLTSEVDTWRRTQ